MEAVSSDGKLTGQLQVKSLSQNLVVRQLAVMVGIAASVALGVAIVLWSQTPNYSLLFGDLAEKDAAEVVSALQQAGIEFKVDENSGAVMVPTGNLQDVRMKLAGEGLPRGDSPGFALLEKEAGFGTSRALEAARFQRALEGELARTIGSISSVKSARVHLATPKQSVFARKRKKPSASVVLNLFSGRALEKEQVEAVRHLVASSVPELEAGQVTVVDQKGKLLSGQSDLREMMLSTSQLDYTRQLEKDFRQRVEDILLPILGAENVSAQVTADVDFTVTEQTEERFNPDLPALRSEQINEQSGRVAATQGVPGALSNQPPVAGQAPEQANGAAAVGGEPGAGPFNTSKRATRNYELDKTISHTRLSSGTLRRLSVAVVVDDKVALGEDGATTRVQRSPEEISRITELVKEAVGFNATRGDSVRVINATFMAPIALDPLPEPAIWEEPWVWDLAKQTGGVLLVLMLILFVLKPTMKRLTAPPVMERVNSTVAGQESAEGQLEQNGHALPGGGNQFKLPGPERYENTLEAARSMVHDDPKRVAQVVRSWVSEDAG